MKRLAGLALTLLTVVLLSSRAQAQEPRLPDVTPEERAFVAAKVYQYVTTYFAHRRASPVKDFDAAFKQYIARALKADGRVAFDLATAEFVASLGNGHTQFVDRSFSPRLGSTKAWACVTWAGAGLSSTARPRA